MAQGGAPQLPGTNEASHFYHQPPPIIGLSISDPHLTECREADVDVERSTERSTEPVHSPRIQSPGARTPHRARFPENEHELERRIPAARPNSAQLYQPLSGRDAEKDGEPGSHRPGVWDSFRGWLQSVKHDVGAPEQRRDVTELMGDTGIDVHTIQKLRHRHKRNASYGMMGSGGAGGSISNLVAPSLMLARPGLGQHRNSGPIPGLSDVSTTPVVGTPGQWWTQSHSVSGSSTPNTHSYKKSQAGVDPFEVARRLKKLKDRVAKSKDKDSRQSKYVQAKADLAHRRNVVLLMVYAFMAYGAPSHRLEEYILALFKALDMEGRVNYTVGCTNISFINPPDPADPMTRSAYTTMVKAQGLDIGALELAWRIYKDVVHGDVTIEEATDKLVELIESPAFYHPWVIVPFYGLASAFAAVWAYNGWWTDMAVSFVLGSVVGFLQTIVATSNPLYSNVLEVSAAILTSFGARAFASIGGPEQAYFCFGAVAESSITLILPGYIVLCGSLELQSKSITAGSTRLFYAVMYSLLLGYGINVGAQLWAVMYPAAPTSATCPRAIDPRWKMLLVPSYLVLQAVLIRSRPRQMPVQVLLGSAAYTVNYFVSQFATAQVAVTASALTLGVLGHLWARTRAAFAFASVVAGIMVLVPSGLSAQGGLISGIATPLFNNGTTKAQQVYEQNIYQSFSVGAQMIQVGVGLAVGLFISALVVYPLGRKNNALFSF